MATPQITATLDQLIEVLEQCEHLYQELLPLFDREKRAALGSNSRQLADVTVEKEELLARLSNLEKKRVNLISLMADHLQLPLAQLTLSELAARADAGQAARMRKLRDSLGPLVKTVKRANTENRLLFHHCLDLAHRALGFFQHWMKPASIYSSSGRVNNGRQNGKLLSGTV